MRPRKKDAHLPRCVHFKHGAYYYVKGGKWTFLSRDLAEALELYASMIETPKGGMVDLIDRVMAHITPNLKPNTVKQYNIAADRLRKYLVEFSPAQVKSKHVAAIKIKLASTPNMANRILSLLKVIFSHAVEWQEVDSNPCIGIKRHEENTRDRYITDEEYLTIYGHAGERLQIIMDLCYLTGQRIGDVLATKLSDITDEGIAFQPEKTKRKTGKRLIIKWSPALEATVARAKQLHQTNGKIRSFIPTLLFNRKNKAPDYSTTRELWAKAVSAAAVNDATIHDLRAKSLTDTEAQGGDPQKLGNHANRAMTERYIRRRQTPRVEGPSFRHLIDDKEKG